MPGEHRKAQVNLMARRLLAFGIDCAILFIVLAPLGVLVQLGLGLRPDAPREIYLALVLNFSLPVWIYFTMTDGPFSRASLGKRIMKLRVATMPGGRRIGWGRSLARTALKLVPWELTHLASFGMAGAPAPLIWITFAAVYALLIGYAVYAWRSEGRRAPYDMLLSTEVTRTSASGAHRGDGGLRKVGRGRAQ